MSVSPSTIISEFGDNVTFICTAMGGNSLSYQWTVNGNPVGNDSVLTLVNIDASYGGNYTCTVSNTAGSDSAFTTLYVAPYIVNPLEVEVLTANGSHVNITCEADGFPAPNVTWTIMLGSVVSSTTQLLFQPVRFDDEGMYLCEASVEINETVFAAITETLLIGKKHYSIK